MKIRTLSVIALAMSLLSTNSMAENLELAKCQDAKLLSGSLITNVAWDSMYPIKLAGVTLGPKGSGAPPNASKRVFCACEDDLGIFVPGFTTAMYEPARLIELVREPDCFMTLGGANLSMTNGRMRGSKGRSDGYRGNESAFWHYHYFAFPLLQMLEMLYPSRCGDGFLDMDLLYISELDPTWLDAELSFFANPEAAIFSNPISVAACMADAVAANVGKPIDSMFWCAGSWGELYPLNGFRSTNASMVTKTSLLATRSVAALHRRLLARQTTGDDALCSAPIYPTIPKSQYKMSMMYPVSERSGTRTANFEKADGSVETRSVGKGGAHEIGEAAITWGEWRNIPSREDNIYMLWRFNDCCSTFY